MSQATLTSKGQVTIPKPVREKLHLSTGAKIEFIIGDDGSTVLLRPITRQVDEVFGRLRQYRKANPVSVEEMDEAIRQRMKETQ